MELTGLDSHLKVSGESGRSEIEFMKMLNIRESRMDPCGTPEVTGIASQVQNYSLLTVRQVV